MKHNSDEIFMSRAIELAKSAVEHGNEPFGAVLVKDGEIVFENENQIYTRHDPTFHAEAGLIRRFCEETCITDLSEYTLYSSCEPCFMCCSAMVWTKLGRLVYGASDIDLCDILGVQGSECCKLVFENSDNNIEVESGIMRDESIKLFASISIPTAFCKQNATDNGASIPTPLLSYSHELSPHVLYLL